MPLVLEIHLIQDPLRHLALGESSSELQYPVSKSGLAVIDVSDYAEVPDSRLVQIDSSIGGSAGSCQRLKLVKALSNYTTRNQGLQHRPVLSQVVDQWPPERLVPLRSYRLKQHS